MLELKERIKINAEFIKYSNLYYSDNASDAVKTRFNELYELIYLPMKPKCTWREVNRDVYIPKIRLWHIAYSMMKGKTYEQIETKVHECNKLTEAQWKFIKEIQAKYGVPDEPVTITV